MKLLNLIATTAMALAAGATAVPIDATTDSTVAELGGSAMLESLPEHTECNDARYKAAKADTIIDGITHLNKKAMKGATCKAKKQSCSRVSCSYNSAIFLCNENDFSIAPECKLVADYAFKVIQDCKYPLPPKGLYVNGQHFNESGSWNVVVRHDKC